MAKEEDEDVLDSGEGNEGERRGRQKVSVTVTESDTKLPPKLIARLLISPANDCHSLSQNGRECNPYSSVFLNLSLLNNDPNKFFKYEGEQVQLPGPRKENWV